MMNRIRFILAALVLHAAVYVSASSFSGRFHSVPLPSGTTVSVFSIIQDPQGFIWLGTDDGLVRHDGYDCKVYRWSSEDSLSIVNNVVNALACDAASGHIYAGTDKGVSVYDPLSDSFHEMEALEGRHVKSFLSDGDLLYVGTTTGLFAVGPDGAELLFDGHVASVRKVGDDIWAGSYDCMLRLAEDGAEIHDLKDALSGNNVLVLDICSDPFGNHPLLLGTESGLVSYDPATGKAGTVRSSNVPVKTFHSAGQELWVGTDSGLIVVGEDNSFICRHEVGDVSSLPDNVVWSIFEDNRGGIWLGTDHGAAVADVSGAYRYVGIDRLTGGSDGMDVRVMASDSKGRLWLGGRDGLICSDGGLKSGFRLRADSGDSRCRLSHNKVRALYDDGERMWIASDGGLDIYSYHTGRINHCHIKEESGNFSSNWMYCIAEDGHGMLWLGTYDGGVFGVRKEKLQNARGDVVCDIHLSQCSVPALSSNIIRSLIVEDDKLYVNTGTAVDIIDLESYRCRSIPVPDNGFALSLLSAEGGLWVGADNGLYCLEEAGLHRVTDELLAADLAFQDGYIWVAGGNVLSSYIPSTGEWASHPVGDHLVMSIMSVGSCLYAGSVDSVIEVFPESLLCESDIPEAHLTEMWLNDEPVRAGMEYDGNVVIEKNICMAEEVRLRPFQNSFTFSFSSLVYKKTPDTFVYRLNGFDDTWRQLPEGSNKATFINIPSGEYVFEFAVAGREETDASSIKVNIATVWYATDLAYMIYIVLGICLVLAVLYHIRMRHQLQMEHMERERALAMADSKTTFLADISHEFKNPLSIILDSVSRMVTSESDALRTKELQTLQRNAEKIHLLLNQMVEFNENRNTGLFMPSAVSIADLAKEVWDRFADSFAHKDISARFVADDIGYIFMVDRVQMEAVFQNLLSNALKFTSSGGSVLMSVSVKEETADMLYVDIKVEDTGCGMTEDELSHIFDRYYVAPSGAERNREGSGLGLHIVKTAVDMHKGTVSVASEQGKGSCFTVTLSTLKADSFILKAADGREEWTLHSLSQVWQHRRRPSILLVEDNNDIRDLVVASLGKDYTFLMASEGGQALEILKTEKVDLVVTDIVMPGMDGLAMCKAVRGSLKTAFLPIIVLTGKTDMQTQAMSYEYADIFISKPFDLDWLNNCIIQLLIKHEQYLEKMKQQKVLEPSIEDVESPDSRFLQKMMEIVGRHMDDSDFSAAVLSEEGRLSDKQVYRKMKQLTGKTPTEFIRDVRLEKAAMYLSQGKLTVMEVMYKVGFTTASYFSKCFKEKYGVNPSEFKNTSSRSCQEQ